MVVVFIVRNNKRNEENPFMKLSVSYNFFNGEELIYYAVKHMRSMADHISIVYQEISNIGNKISPNSHKVLTKINNENLVDDLILYNPDFSLTPYQNEHNKRKLGYECAKVHNATHFLCSDVDEFYKFDEFQNAKEYIFNHDIKYSACHSYFYIKQPFYRSQKIDTTNVCFICAIDDNTIFKLNEPTPFPKIDGTRSIINKVDRKIFFREDQITMHHMNFVRKSFISKFNNTSSRKNPHLQNFLKELEQSIASWKFGENFHFPQKESYEIIKTDNYFNLPIMEQDISSISVPSSKDKRKDKQNNKDKLNVTKLKSRLKNSQERKLKILLTNHHLLDFTGSEVFTFTMADYLKKNGHDIIVYSKYIDRIRDYFSTRNIPVIDNLHRIKHNHFDVAHVHHNINALEVRYFFPNLPIVFLSHGVLPFLEQPPLIDINISKYLAVSEEVKNNLINKIGEAHPIDVYHNIVDSTIFHPISPINEKPRNALVISSRIDQVTEDKIRKACSRSNIGCEFIGLRFRDIDYFLVAQHINRADIVFSLGRGAIEAMMCARVPIVYDYLGGDGLITPANFTDIMKCNFSGRVNKIDFTVESLIEEISKYRPDYGEELRKMACEYYGDETQGPRIVEIYNNVMEDIISPLPKQTQSYIDYILSSVNESRAYTENLLYRKYNKTPTKVASNYSYSKSGLHKQAIQVLNKNMVYGPRVSIIIPVFNKMDLTKQCLTALIENTPDSLYEVIIIDNASTDGTGDFLAALEGDVRIITNRENLGFARACNQGARAASGEYLIFLNNDTMPHKNWLTELVDVVDAWKDVGIVGSRLLFPDNTIQHAGVAMLPALSHMYPKMPADFLPANKPRDLNAVTGACMLVRRELFFSAGCFHEGYINGCEDIDLCMSVREAGKRVFYNPRSVLTHFEGQTPGREDRMDDNRKILFERWKDKMPADYERYLSDDGFRKSPTDKTKWDYHEDQCKKTISIIIVTYNSLHDIKRCLSSIQACTNLPYEVFVIDNNSTDGTRDYLKGIKGIHVIINDENIGFARACNQGIQAAKGEYIVLLNPDTEVTTDWAWRMILHFRDGVGAVGPVSNYVAGIQKYELYRKEDPGKADNNGISDRFHEWNKNQSVETKLLVGFCMMVKSTVMDDIGMLDEDFFLGIEDLEYSWRLRQKGYKLAVATDVFIFHQGQKSFSTVLPEKNRRITQECQDKLYDKLEAFYGKGRVPSSLELWGMDWFQPSQIMKPKITSIIILCFNQIEYTRQCLKSIEKYTSVPYELILVDNASTDGTGEFLKEYESKHPGCNVILNKDNRGFAAGNNQGIAAAKGDYILLLNNDVIVTQDWLERLIAHIESDSNIGMVGPVSNSVSGPQLVDNTGYGNNLNKMHQFAQDYSEKNAGRTQDILRLVGFCLLTKRQVIDIIGGLDESYGNGNYEDDDLCLRSNIAGFRNIVAHDVFIHHYGSMTFKGNAIDYWATMQGNRKIFADKWKGIVEIVPDGYRTSLTRDQQLKKLIAWGEARFSQGNVHSAVKIFERVLKMDGTNSQALNNLGVIQWQLGDIVSAMKTFQTALILNPKDADALGNLAQAAKETARFDLIKPGLLDKLRQTQRENPDLLILINSLQNDVRIS